MSQQRPASPPILFDLDGTLIDSVYEHVLAWSAVLREQKINGPDWKIHRRIGMSGKSLARQLLREAGADGEAVDIEKLNARHDEIFLRQAKKLPTLPGATDLLRFLTEMRIRWAIATTGNARQTKLLLKNLKLPTHAVVVTGDDVAKAKPSPDIFLLAAEKLGVALPDCVVVGDAIWDMLAAGRKRALGVGLLTGGYSKAELGESGAFRVYADPADMLAHIEDLGIQED